MLTRKFNPHHNPAARNPASPRPRSPSADDPEAQSSLQSSGDGDETPTGTPTGTAFTNADYEHRLKRPNPIIPPLTNDNPLIGSQDRQRASLKQLRRCLETNTRNESSMSETSDEEVDFGSPDIGAIQYTDSDHAWK